MGMAAVGGDSTQHTNVNTNVNTSGKQMDPDRQRTAALGGEAVGVTPPVQDES